MERRVPRIRLPRPTRQSVISAAAPAGGRTGIFTGKSRFFCFTGNDPVLIADGDAGVFYPEFSMAVGPHLGAVRHGISGIIFQMERAPTSGMLHLQGYFETPGLTTFDTLHNYECFRDRDYWITAADGSAAKNIVYCTKPDDLPEELGLRFSFRWGELVGAGQGRRTDILAVKRQIDQGVSELEIWRAEETFQPMLKYHKGFDRYRILVTVGNCIQRRVIVYWGPTGTGKSHSAKQRFPTAYRVPHPKGSGTYWDGYTGQSAVIVEEMSGARFSHNFLLDLCGDTPLHVPIHGGLVPFTSTYIVFTADRHPGHWYSKLYAEHPHLWAMFERRIEEVHHRTVRYVGPEVTVRNWPVPPPQCDGAIDNRVLLHDEFPDGTLSFFSPVSE